jgi:predicted small lipoprotein YifL
LLGDQAETAICVNIIAEYFWVKIAMRSSYLSIILGLFLLAGGLAGCGTKGPLYIPEQRYPQAAERAHALQVTVITPAKLTPKA